MRPALAKLRGELGRSTFEAREALAAKLFEPETVRNLMLAAARLGGSHLKLTPEVVLDLRETVAAKTLEAGLKHERLSFVWDLCAGQPSQTGEARYALVIQWADAHKEHALALRNVGTNDISKP